MDRYHYTFINNKNKNLFYYQYYYFKNHKYHYFVYHYDSLWDKLDIQCHWVQKKQHITFESKNVKFYNVKTVGLDF